MASFRDGYLFPTISARQPLQHPIEVACPGKKTHAAVTEGDIAATLMLAAEAGILKLGRVCRKQHVVSDVPDAS